MSLINDNCIEAYQVLHEQKYVHETRVLRQLDLNRKCTETHLRASTFSKIFRGYTPDPFFTAGRGNDGDSWERRVREGREGEGNV
jgi:hypothetical protein